ncbi:MAG: FAD-dependent oxidoreductase [Anaerolineae bacterium]
MSTDPQTLVAELVDWYGRWFDDEQALADGQMTADLHPYDHLFSPIQVNAIKIKNRLVMGPMGNVSMADETGRPGAKMIEYYVERARGGVGLITSGLVPVSFKVDPSFLEPGGLVYLPRLDGSRSVLAGWRDLAAGIHAYGARCFVPLSPGAGRVGSPECLVKRRRLPVSASWNPNFYMPAVPCRPLWDHECRALVRATGQAAADAQACLADGVYLHGHEGYLLEQFANPAFNRRPFGPFADPEALGLALVREIRRRCGPRFPLMYRIDLSLALAEVYGQRMEEIKSLRRFRGERGVEATLAYMRHLVEAGVDLFDVDLGCYDNWWLPHPPGPMPPGCYLAVARLVKEHFAQRGVRSVAGLEVPVVAVGKLGYPDLAERALRDGACDMVMLARPLLADPDWPRKAYAGRTRDIMPCIGDQEACLNEFVHGGHIQCAVNPRTGFEERWSHDLPPAPVPRRIGVVGAGPAGVTAACVAAARGHRVTLFERQDRPGGMLRAGAVPRIKFDVANYLAYLEHRLRDCQHSYDLEVAFRTEAGVEVLRASEFDALVLCTGGRPVAPPVDGIDLPHVVQAIDLLLDPGLADGAGRVVVVGGGDVGCETAHFLAHEHDKQVTVIEMLPYFMQASCTANRGYLIHFLERQGVALWNCTRLLRVEPGRAMVSRNVSPSVPSPYVTWQPVLPENVVNPLARPLKVEEQEVAIEADLVVLATGMLPDDALYHACQGHGVAPEIHNAGDAFIPATIAQATKAGYALGRAV